MNRRTLCNLLLGFVCLPTQPWRWAYGLTNVNQMTGKSWCYDTISLLAGQHVRRKK